MKKYKIALAALALFIVMAACVYPASADILVNYPEPDYNSSTQKVYVKVTIKGGNEVAPASNYSRDVILLIDISTSMREEYENKTRLDWAKEAIKNYFLRAYNIYVGVVAFSDHASAGCSLTPNLEKAGNEIDRLSCYGGSTNLIEGINLATDMLKRRERTEALPIIILITDGGFEKEGLAEAIEFAAKENIVMYPIGIGRKEEIDKVALENIAKKTGGEYTYIDDLKNLGEPLEKLLKMEEFLSAANLDIKLSQDDAIIDVFSISREVITPEGITPGTVLANKGYFECSSPKIREGEGIMIKFDAFCAKEGEITIGTVNGYYTDSDGIKKEIPPISIKKYIPTPLPWKTFTGILVAGAILLFLSLVLIIKSSKSKIKRGREEEKETAKSSLREIEDGVSELRRGVEEELGSYNKVMSEELREKFNKLLEIIEEKKR